jgi:homoserine dehydrogenase
VVRLMLQEGRTRPPLRIVGIADSSGGISTEGDFELPLEELLAWKTSGCSIRSFKMGGKGASALNYHASTISMVAGAGKPGNILLDGTPVDLKTGGVGLECCRFAASHGIHLVMANKAPLVLAYGELMAAAAREPRCRIEFSASVCGGLPVVNVGRRDLGCARLQSVRGIFNSTSNYILSRMARGEDPAVALRAAQEVGIAEADPSLDLEGYDTANKLVIICNSVLGFPATLSDVALTGIGGVTAVDMQKAALEGEVYRLLATATLVTAHAGTPRYTLSVQPERVKADSFFGTCTDSDMCVVFRSDEFETISMKTDEKGVFPTAAAMLRDCFTIIREEGCSHC